jgi:histidine ammonia-lyase
MNSSDHNPAVRVGASPGDSWELRTPQLAQFYVKGSAGNHYQHGYIFSNANWDPFPMANDIEALSIAVANMDIAVAQRMLRFTNKFFTVTQPPAESPGEPGRFQVTNGSDIDSTALMQEIQTLIEPVAPQGSALIQNVEDLQGQTRLKVVRARAVIADTVDLLAEDLLTGTYWLDLRKSYSPNIRFGESTDALWQAFRSVLPFDGVQHSAVPVPIHEVAVQFIRGNAASRFYRNDAREPEHLLAPPTD